MRKLFGTDGVRGTANQDPMTSEMALRIGAPRPTCSAIPPAATGSSSARTRACRGI